METEISQLTTVSPERVSVVSVDHPTLSTYVIIIEMSSMTFSMPRTLPSTIFAQVTVTNHRLSATEGIVHHLDVTR